VRLSDPAAMMAFRMLSALMAGLVPAINATRVGDRSEISKPASKRPYKDFRSGLGLRPFDAPNAVGGRDKPGHDNFSVYILRKAPAPARASADGSPLA
jgi:hypothetical protein